MDEKTMRWPGHVEAIRPLIEQRTLVETFKRECVRTPAIDRVVMRVDVGGPKGRRCYELEDRYDEKSGLTAMARTTALTCASVARWMAQGPSVKGVLPLELLPQAAPFVLDRAKGHGIRLEASR
jgi:hypothetical protein